MAGDHPQPSASSALVCRGTQQAPRPRRPSATPWRPLSPVRKEVRCGGSVPVCGVPGRAPSPVYRDKGSTSTSRASVADCADVSENTRLRSPSCGRFLSTQRV